jgi:hypothetical protein
LSPWRRLSDEPAPITKPVKFMEGLIINFMMRLVGFIIRLALLAFGLVVTVTAICLAGIGFVLWFIMPAIIVLLFIGGFYFILI